MQQADGFAAIFVHAGRAESGCAEDA